VHPDGKTLDDPQRLKFHSQELYLKSEAEMQTLFREVPEALAATAAIAERARAVLDFESVHLPVYNVPPGYTEDAYLRELCEQGLARRYGDVGEEVRRRLEYELQVITQMGYSSYFLIVWDLSVLPANRGSWWDRAVVRPPEPGGLRSGHYRYRSSALWAPF
jgi:DNA polymerase-3 subunit alpha